MSPFESAMTLPCSALSSSASSVILASTSRLNSNITRARRWGLVEDQPSKAFWAACTARSSSAAEASCTRACTSPVFGLNTSEKRPEAPVNEAPSMK